MGRHDTNPTSAGVKTNDNHLALSHEPTYQCRVSVCADISSRASLPLVLVLGWRQSVYLCQLWRVLDRCAKRLTLGIML